MYQHDKHPSIPLERIKQIAVIIDSGIQLNNRELLINCRGWGVDGLAIDPHLCNEIAETALNYLIITKYGEQFLAANNPRTACTEILRPL